MQIRCGVWIFFFNQTGKRNFQAQKLKKKMKDISTFRAQSVTALQQPDAKPGLNKTTGAGSRGGSFAWHFQQLISAHIQVDHRCMSTE